MSVAKQSDLLILAAHDVRLCLPMTDAIEAMRGAFAALSQGEAVMPERARILIASPPGTALFMPSYVPRLQMLGIKTVTLFDDNPQRGLPLLHGLFCLFNADDGRPQALLDAASLTAIRTGAVSGLATDLLARADARKATVFGAGVQGRTQLEAVCAVRPIEQARVYDVDLPAARRFAQEMSAALAIPVLVADSPAEAVRDADVICTATVAREPVFHDRDLPAGVHINAVGSYKPTVREVPGETVARALVVVDYRPAALAEAGDLIEPLRQGLIAHDHLQAELGELITAKAAGRTSPEQVTLFKSVGLAIQDLAAACAAVENAAKLQLGIRVAI